MASGDEYQSYKIYKVPDLIQSLVPVLFSATHFLPYGNFPGDTSFQMGFYKWIGYLLQKIAAIKMIRLHKVSGAWTFGKTSKNRWRMQQTCCIRLET
jgi:hypothetical protein